MDTCKICNEAISSRQRKYVLAGGQMIHANSEGCMVALMAKIQRLQTQNDILIITVKELEKDRVRGQAKCSA